MGNCSQSHPGGESSHPERQLPKSEAKICGWPPYGQVAAQLINPSPNIFTEGTWAKLKDVSVILSASFHADVFKSVDRSLNIWSWMDGDRTIWFQMTSPARESRDICFELWEEEAETGRPTLFKSPARTKKTRINTKLIRI